MTLMYWCMNCGNVSHGLFCCEECEKEYEQFITETLKKDEWNVKEVSKS